MVLFCSEKQLQGLYFVVINSRINVPVMLSSICQLYHYSFLQFVKTYLQNLRPFQLNCEFIELLCWLLSFTTTKHGPVTDVTLRPSGIPPTVIESNLGDPIGGPTYTSSMKLHAPESKLYSWETSSDEKAAASQCPRTIFLVRFPSPGFLLIKKQNKDALKIALKHGGIGNHDWE